MTRAVLNEKGETVTTVSSLNIIGRRGSGDSS
jgi:hypothetical protein